MVRSASADPEPVAGSCRSGRSAVDGRAPRDPGRSRGAEAAGAGAMVAPAMTASAAAR
jgi:hypothetical protein